MTAAPLLVGIDVGTSRIKALLLDRSGREVATSAVATPWAPGPPGRVECGAGAMVGAAGEALGRLREDLGRVVGVGLAGMAESGVALDAGRRPLSPVIAWHDRRGEEAVAVLHDTFGEDVDGWIGQRARTVLSAVKLAWLVEHGVGGIERWLGVPELVLHALTGAEAIEHSLAARTGCYDVGERRWRPEVARALGFPVDVFAPLAAAGAIMGHVTAGGSAWSGLPAGTPVTIAGHDHLVGALGAGSAGRDDLVNSVGTAETVIARVEQRPDVSRTLAHRLAVTVFPGGDAWAVLASATRAGLVLRSAAESLGASFEDLDGEADAAPRAADAARWIAALAAGDRAAPPLGAPGEVWRGVLEALAAGSADAARRVMAATDGDPRRIVVFGSGSRSRPWLRAKAAALPLPVVRSTVAEAVARGAAVLAGVAAGWWPSVDAAPVPAVEAPA